MNTKIRQLFDPQNRVDFLVLDTDRVAFSHKENAHAGHFKDGQRGAIASVKESTQGNCGHPSQQLGRQKLGVLKPLQFFLASSLFSPAPVLFNLLCDGYGARCR